MARIVLCGEAFGAREALFEHPFVGYSGQELARMLHQAELAPALPHERPSELEMIRYWKSLRENDGIRLANVFNTQPRDNDIELFFTSVKEGGDKTLPPLKAGKYLRPELRFYLDALHDIIRQEEPNLVVAFGNTACWALLGETKISSLRGTLKMSPTLGVKVLPTYHPAAVLRQWNLRPIVLSDLEKAAREADSGVINRIERWLTVEPTLSEIAEWFQRPAAFYAVDIENPAKFISMIGFARSHDDALVVPFFDENKPGGNYWPSVQEEAAAWRHVAQALASPVPKIFQNGIYDLTHLLRLGLRPNACQEDTMLLHHALYPEMLKGLGFLGSIYTSEIAWKSMRGKGNNLKRDE